MFFPHHCIKKRPNSLQLSAGMDLNTNCFISRQNRKVNKVYNEAHEDKNKNPNHGYDLRSYHETADPFLPPPPLRKYLPAVLQYGRFGRGGKLCQRGPCG